jgi:beta propeller repeat protein
MICTRFLRNDLHTTLFAGLLALALCSCSRVVSVEDEGVPAPTVGSPPGPGGAPSAGTGAVANPVGAAGAPSGAGEPGVNAPAATPLADAGMAGSAAGTSVMQGIDQTVGADSRIGAIEILAVFLSAIELPAVGSAGVSVTQYFGMNQAATLYVDWNGLAQWWHLTSRAYYIDTAASQTRHLGLVYDMTTYGVYSGDDPRELSGTPTSYKEHLAANANGFAWVDYATRGAGAQPPIDETEALGEVVFQSWSGERSVLTDALRYRARLDLSETHVAFVEYSTTGADAVGQIVVQPIAGGDPIAVAATPHHQDRPAIDGDWVVWEEYLSDQDSVIRARNLATGEVRDLSTRTGFRTNPDILGTRVAWEDQRSGDGDIYFIDLDRADGERVAVSGSGHSAAVRLSSDGLVWIETVDDVIALLRARWLP